MTRISRKLAQPLAAALALAAMALPVAAQAPELAMLDRLERGTWALRLRPGGGTMQICVRTGRELLQLRHRQAGCSRFIIQDEASEVTVQYTCRGHGYGRTTIRRESAQLAQVRSQGIEDGVPFSIEGEARRIGSC